MKIILINYVNNVTILVKIVQQVQNVPLVPMDTIKHQQISVKNVCQVALHVLQPLHVIPVSLTYLNTKKVFLY